MSKRHSAKARRRSIIVPAVSPVTNEEVEQAVQSLTSRQRKSLEEFIPGVTDFSLALTDQLVQAGLIDSLFRSSSRST